MELAPGTQLTHNLRLVRQLGAGGMGTVWIAHHEGLASDVVVKFISEHTARTPEALARFSREAAAAAQVKSRHVVQMLDHGIAQNGLPYIAMELLEGEDLAHRLYRERRLSPRATAAVIVQVARALQRAHEKGIIHRDIKPENVFLCDTGEGEAFVKVLDFGIAKLTPGTKTMADDGAPPIESTVTGTMVGTAAYMSPEQIVGAKTLDHRTDLWSLGVVAFQALTGVRPFTGETQGAVLLAVCTGEIPKPSTFNAELTPALDAWFAKACARDPDKRFHSARVMAAALEEAVGSAGAIPETGPATIPDNALDATVEAQPPGSLLRELGRAPVVRTSTTTGGGTLEQGTAPRAPATSPRAGRLAAIGLVVAALLGVAFMMRTKSTPTPTPAAPTPSVASAEARPEPAVVESATASASSPASASVSVAPPKIPKPAPAKSAAKPPPATAPTKPADEVIE